ncbi:hypothetical protein N7495_000860 [Penicillium taxi]|uniref:uncharacterized protein n=1 Tax=Penicillium taxi TaxID=168475 RepID=UPI0025458C4E|nr:uncharacterized protein N7495_000860 [Penicillium taxi]KAJ5908178.1 hypothetical protein N7495_000860 [Penicillium taxi]
MMDQNTSRGLVVIAPISPLNRFLGSEKLNGAAITFFTSNKVSKTKTDGRLEYLFWRIWSSEALLNNLDVSLIDRLVTNIMHSDFRTEAIKPVRLPDHFLMQSIKSIKEIPQQEFIFSAPTHEIPTQVICDAAKSGPCETRVPLHPILKKTKTVQGDTPKTARLLLSNPDGESITLNPSIQPNPTLLTEEMPDNSGKLATKRNLVAVSRPTRGGRRRPVFSRRKSSQSSIPKAQPSPARPRFKLDDDFDLPEVTHDEDFTYETETDNQAKRDLEDTWTELDRPVQAPILSRDADLISEKLFPSPETELINPILHQVRRTVSIDPKDEDIQCTEESVNDSTIKSSESSDSPDSDFDENVPGFLGMKRVRMPKAMFDGFASILTNHEPIDDYIPLPQRPWYAAEHAWGPLPRDQYLLDSILLDENAAPNPQPSHAPLVAPGFRQRFHDFIEETREEPKMDARTCANTYSKTYANSEDLTSAGFPPPGYFMKSPVETIANFNQSMDELFSDQNSGGDKSDDTISPLVV